MFIFVVLVNIPHRYTEKGNLIGMKEPGNRDHGEIVADLTSTFTVLLAIYFPSVTGNNHPRSGDTMFLLNHILFGLHDLHRLFNKRNNQLHLFYC